MTPKRRKAIRVKLGLSQPQMAEVLESSQDSVSRMERDLSMPTARPAPTRVDQLLLAYESGFRPAGWPKVGRAGQHGRVARTGDS